jgi:hypothetical protein
LGDLLDASSGCLHQFDRFIHSDFVHIVAERHVQFVAKEVGQIVVADEDGFRDGVQAQIVLIVVADITDCVDEVLIALLRETVIGNDAVDLFHDFGRQKTDFVVLRRLTFAA